MRLLSLILFLIPALLFGQGKKIKSIQTSKQIVYATVDRAGDFYVVLADGEIQKYDKQGERLQSFKHKGVPTLFDPTNAMRLLVYYRDLEEYAWLSPDLELSSFLKIDPSFAIEPILLCPSGERDLWVLDASDFSVKKINQSTGFTKVNPITGTKSIGSEKGREQNNTSITNEFIVKPDVIPSAVDIMSMREYQNMLFLFDQKRGIAVYNNLGKLMRFIEVRNLKSYNFLGEELYFIENGKVKFLNMFSGEKSELKLEQPADFVLLTDERIVLIKNDQLDVYEFQPLK